MSSTKSLHLSAQDGECALYVLISALKREICHLQIERGIFESRLKNIENRFCFDSYQMEQKLTEGLIDQNCPEAKLWFDEFSLHKSAQRDLEEAQNLYNQLLDLSKQRGGLSRKES
ncbi:MAG: hypothetical protein ACE5OZ_17915 [Candidatus Heimdallarchaeota archaeon]